MERGHQLVIFTLDEQRYALPLEAVERAVRVVECTPLPKAPAIVVGMVNVQGRIIPVLAMRKRLRLPERDIHVSDQLLIAHSSTRTVALLVDAVGGIVARSAPEVIPAQKILPGLEYVEGVVKLEDGMVVIYDLDSFLSLEEEKALDEAMKASCEFRV
jgi:purine-binding chemotaxis protein CheW